MTLGGSRTTENFFFFKLKMNFRSLFIEKKTETASDVMDCFYSPRGVGDQALFIMLEADPMPKSIFKVKCVSIIGVMLYTLLYVSHFNFLNGCISAPLL